MCHVLLFQGRSKFALCCLIFLWQGQLEQCLNFQSPARLVFSSCELARVPSLWLSRCWYVRILNTSIQSFSFQRSEEEPPKVRRNPRRSQSLLLVLLLQSRRWLRRHVGQSVQKFLTNAFSRFRRHVQKFLMNAYSLVSLVSICKPKVNAECATNEVVQFFVFVSFWARSSPLSKILKLTDFLKRAMVASLTFAIIFTLSWAFAKVNSLCSPNHVFPGVSARGFFGYWEVAPALFVCCKRFSLGSCSPVLLLCSLGKFPVFAVCSVNVCCGFRVCLGHVCLGHVALLCC